MHRPIRLVPVDVLTLLEEAVIAFGELGADDRGEVLEKMSETIRRWYETDWASATDEEIEARVLGA